LRAISDYENPGTHLGVAAAEQLVQKVRKYLEATWYVLPAGNYSPLALRRTSKSKAAFKIQSGILLIAGKEIVAESFASSHPQA
jgi:hypothetical protein